MKAQLPPPVPRPKKIRKDGRPWNPGHKNRLIARQREQTALDMRIQGHSYSEIAEALGITEAAVYKRIDFVLNKFNEDVKENVPQARKIELDRCDVMLKALWPKIKAGNEKAITAGLKVAERRARLSGIDLPQEMIHKGTGENDAIAVEVFRRMISDAESSAA